MRPALISIISPVYNADKYLSKMIDSVLAQTYKHWELLLVNDGSTDLTDIIIKEYLQKDNRIKYFNQSNAGPSVARNKGILEAIGMYLCFIDADDWVSSDYLEKLIEPLLTTDVDLVCAGYYEVNKRFPKGLQLHDFKKEQYNDQISKKEFLSNLFNGVAGVLWAKLFKKEMFTSNNIQLHPDLRLSEDLIAVLEYAMHIKTAYIVPDAIYYYNRLEEEGLSGTFKLSNYKDLQTMKKEVEKYRNELLFLDLDAIFNKRKYSFMVKLLRDNVNSHKEFFEVAAFLVKNASPLEVKSNHPDKINNKILHWIFQGHYFRSWMVLSLYEMVRKLKNA